MSFQKESPKPTTYQLFLKLLCVENFNNTGDGKVKDNPIGPSQFFFVKI
jgi:hypothetical protein